MRRTGCSEFAEVACDETEACEEMELEIRGNASVSIFRVVKRNLTAKAEASAGTQEWSVLAKSGEVCLDFLFRRRKDKAPYIPSHFAFPVLIR